MKCKLHPAFLTALVASTFAISVVWADIQGSSHDFSTSGWAGGQVCLPCHVPHEANQSISGSPLWNRAATGVTYSLYASPSLTVQPEQPRTPSLLCLGCHDGVTAVDTFGAEVGSHYIQGTALIGTDLSNDHPSSIQWQHQTGLPNLTCANCHNFHIPNFQGALPFYDGYVECSTCHDPHNKESLPSMLRLPTTDSQICRHCHAK